VVAQLRIADALAHGPKRVDELAGDADPDAVHRVLRALASDGVFAEDEPGLFRNTEVSEPLRTDSGQGWHEFALQFGGEWYEAFARFPEAVETAQPTFPKMFGADFETWMREHPDKLEVFNRSMAAGAAGRIEEVGGLEWNGEIVVDVGGGTGGMLSELLRRHPGLRGVLFDLPEVVADAEVPEGCRVVGGSFLEGVPEGDAYVLSRILHGFDDETAELILRNVRAAAHPGARVLLVDAVVPEGNEPHGNKWLDLLMLVLSGGRERTAGEWRGLLERAGLEPVSIEDGLIQARCP
jgi:hypothetical protein